MWPTYKDPRKVIFFVDKWKSPTVWFSPFWFLTRNIYKIGIFVNIFRIFQKQYCKINGVRNSLYALRWTFHPFRDNFLQQFWAIFLKSVHALLVWICTPEWKDGVWILFRQGRARNLNSLRIFKREQDPVQIGISSLVSYYVRVPK